jgi:aquaporin Z
VPATVAERHPTLGQVWRPFASELIGTFVLVLAIVLLVILNFGTTLTAGLIPDPYARLLLTGLLVGSTAAAVIYSPVGRISGAHLNPALTFAFVLEGQLPWAVGARYALAQLLGAVAAAGVGALAWPRPAAAVGYATTVPADGTMPLVAPLLEAAMTFVLIAVIFYCLHHPRIARATGAAVGVTVFAIVALIGTTTGASVNPARSLGPSLVAGNFEAQWVYVVGPLVGASLAVAVHRAFPWLCRPVFFHLNPHLPHFR